VGTPVDEDSSLGRGSREWGGEVSWLTYWPPGNDMVDTVCCGILETAIVYRGNSVRQMNRVCRLELKINLN
jgi:hypothetical protein